MPAVKTNPDGPQKTANGLKKKKRKQTGLIFN